MSERPITKSEVILIARVVGGLPMVDAGEADDKIIAVLANDYFWGDVGSIEELPDVLVERLRHYFMTYKLVPDREPPVSIGPMYGRDHALAVVDASMADYQEEYGE